MFIVSNQESSKAEGQRIQSFATHPELGQWLDDVGKVRVELDGSEHTWTKSVKLHS